MKKNSTILSKFKSRFDFIKKHRKRGDLEKIKHNEIDYILSRMSDTSHKKMKVGIYYIQEGGTYEKIFKKNEITIENLDEIKNFFHLFSEDEDKALKVVKKDLQKEQRKLENDGKKKRKEEIKEGKDKFIMNMFNQIQMSLNLTKTSFYNFDYEEQKKEDFFKFLDSLNSEINVFIYNISFKEGEMFLRSKFKKQIMYVYDRLGKIIKGAEKKGDFQDREWKNKIFCYQFDEETNTLYIITPFSVKNNMGSYFECFGTENVKTDHLKYNYIRINGFKLLFINTGKDIEFYFTPENIHEFFENENDLIKSYYLKPDMK